MRLQDIWNDTEYLFYNKASRAVYNYFYVERVIGLNWTEDLFERI